MPPWLLTLDVVDGVVPWTVWGITALVVVVLVARRPTKSWALATVIGALTGAILATAALLVLRASGILPDPLPAVVGWAIGGLAALGLVIVSIFFRPAWRRIVAVVAVLLVLLSTAIGVNAAFGVDRTLGDVLGISTLDRADHLPGPGPEPVVSPAVPLYESWTPPADMPTTGQVLELSGDRAIPSTAGFTPRPASIYLPPAARVAREDMPALPFMVHMMGKPGDPNPTFIKDAMDELAAKNKGLAPIVIVADQLGDPNQNPACADSKTYGGVDTYFNKDIVEYAKANLNILQDPAYWTISGYSNGGACAQVWGAEHPEIWGNIVSISGEEFQGSEEVDQVLAQVFGGDKAAYEAAKPAAVMARNAGRFAGHAAIFTVGTEDPDYIPHVREAAATAKAAGFDTTLFEVPGADHVQKGLRLGMPLAYGALFPHIGLAPPG
ncbi:alpha/beta hydrolase [Microbacterium resistens]|uniref:Esterase n=1 Tax=Microbacterium resistens TaxID=156977 RepID=A0ABY3RML7_9MICO|nr:esterase [Microbacterium resistens]UGS25059.1 esterase [Microbacterium resistens]